MKVLGISLLVLVLITACTTPLPVSQTPASQTPASQTPVSCDLTPVVPPTLAPNPGYAMLDPSTGLHVTGDPIVISPITYRLEVVGQVETPLSLSYDELRCMQRVELRCLLNCPGFFQDEATWAGVPLQDVLTRAGAKANPTALKLHSADGYVTTVRPDVLQDPDNMLAYEWEGQPLPILHGFPLRAVFPSADGGIWAKWLVKIEVY